MRAAFIVLLGFARVFAQVPAPDLRCTEVLPNGDVKLTWLAGTVPADFHSYEVWFSLNKTAAFSLLSPKIFSSASNSFVHSGTPANSQRCYYFMKMKYGVGGKDSTGNSDTISTIFFNILSSAGAYDLKLVYTQLHDPPMLSSSPNFTISKEYPVGTWTTLAVTTATNYADTLSVCTASLSYQVSQADQSGCTSSSNLIKGVYKDVFPPRAPYIDSISVLPNGNTVLGWRIPRDEDIAYYLIDQLKGTIPTIDKVNGRGNTSYVLQTTEANDGPVAIYVKAVDSCENGGVPRYDQLTMHLKTNYDRCLFKTTLKWNSYRLRPAEVKEYQVFCSENGAVFQYLGTTEDTSYVHEKVNPDKQLCYFIRMVSHIPKVSSSSNRVCFFSEQVESPKYVYLRTATVHDKWIEVRALLDSTQKSQGLNLYRAAGDGSYQLLATLNSEGVARFRYEDLNVNPSNTIYKYKVTVRDACGNERQPSNVAQTMLLRVDEDESNTFTRHLSWNAYSEFAGMVSGYNIYRLMDEEGLPGQLIASTDAHTTRHTDQLEPAATEGARVSYYIEAVEGITNPYFIQETSQSNKVAVYIEGRLFIPNAFAPNGVNRTWKPVTHFVDKTDYEVTVYDRWGHLVFTANNDQESWDGSNCKGDAYTYRVSYRNARGEYKESTGFVYLLR